MCQINGDSSGEFASGHTNGQITIWSKQQQPQSQIDGSIHYSPSKTLQPFNDAIYALVFINGAFNFLISCCFDENKIVLYKNKQKKEKEELEREKVVSLIRMSNGLFASGRLNKCLNIWSPSFSSSSSS